MSQHSLPAQSLMQALSLLEIKLAKQEQRSFEQAKELRAREALIQALRAEIDVLRDQNLAALKEIDLRGQQMIALRESYEGSTSWRVTRPLRWLSEKRRGAKVAATSSLQAASGHLTASGALHAGMEQQTGATAMPPAAQTAVQPEDLAVADQHDYVEWVRRFDTITAGQQQLLVEKALKGSNSVRVTLLSVFPAPNASSEVASLACLQAVRDGLIEQHHANWEWLIVGNPGALQALMPWASADDRIRLMEAEVSEMAPGKALNAALERASGKWVAWVDGKVRLRAHALRAALEHLQAHAAAKVLYADEDRMDEQGQRSAPSFRCEANLDLLLSIDYLGQFVLFRREDLVDIGGWSGSLRAGHRHDLLLRLSERWEKPAQAIAHVPHLLSHRLTTPDAPAQSAEALLPCCIDADAVASDDRESVPAVVQAHLARQGLNGLALPHPTLPDVCRVHFTLPEMPPRVGIVIPTRDNVGVLSVCLESLLQESTYPDLRVVVVDNGSVKPETLAYLESIDDPRVQVLRDDAPFNFSRLINRGASAVEGEVLCLLNNDMQITQSDWLEEMVGWALQDGVAAVGARLWYGEGTLQHGGVVLGIQGVAGHAHKHLAKGEPGYLNRAVLHQTMSAVTGACMVVRRAVFEEVGGFDEALAVAYNDVDFCLRARRSGYRNVWTPFAEMIHHESVSRGFEDSPQKQARFQREAALMRERWADWLDHDPAYNPNLTLEYEDFGLAWPPRASVV